MKAIDLTNIIPYADKKLVTVCRLSFTKKALNSLQKIFLLLLFLSINLFPQSRFTLGNENLIRNHKNLVENKKVALLINNVSLLQNKTPLLDTLLKQKIDIVKIFTPEHGFALNEAPGEVVNNSVTANSIPIISIYGKKKAPTQTDLQNVDVVIYDIPDVGARFYTYISSLKLTMKAVARAKVKIIVLDRPNPQNGEKIEGEILKPGFSSFVGISPIPILYGLTVGELAKLFKDEILNKDNLNVDLTVIPMLNYDRTRFYNYYFPNWIVTSPNIRTFQAALLYPGLCFLEATNISEGRGTELPFTQLGAPFINPDLLLPTLVKEFKNLKFTRIKFIPSGSPNYSIKYAGKLCSGLKVKILDNNFNSVWFGIRLLKILKEKYPDKVKIKYGWLNKLYGNDDLEKYLENEITEKKLVEILQKNRAKFRKIRSKYLIY